MLRCSNDSIVGGLTACENPPSGRCQNGISIRPCCLGSTGQCVLTTRQNCSFYDGVWHGDKVSSVRHMRLVTCPSLVIMQSSMAPSVKACFKKRQHIVNVCFFFEITG